MSDEFDKLQRQLEQATAPDCPAESRLDAETASLREGWLALAELLKAAEPASEEPLELRAPLMPVRRVGPKAVGLVALAASLLVAVSVAGRWIRSDRAGGSGSLSEHALSGVISTDREPVGPGPGQIEPASLADRFAWDDPLDQQIASVAQELVRLQQDWDQVDGGFGPLYHGLEAMAEELDQSPL